MKTSVKLFSMLIVFLMLVGACVPAEVASIPAAGLPATQAPAHTNLSPTVEAVIAQLRGLPIEEFFEESYRQLAIRDPDSVIVFTEGTYANVQKGPFAKYGITNDHFTNISPAYVSETQQLTSAILDLLHEYDRSGLTYDQQIAYDIYEWYLDDLVRGFPFTYYSYPVNLQTSGSVEYNNVFYVMDSMLVITAADAQDYLARLSQVDAFVEQLLERMKECEKAGVLPTKYMVERSLWQVARGYSEDPNASLDDPEKSPLYVQFKHKLEKANGIDEGQKEELLEKARVEIKRTVIPAWKKLQEYLTYLMPIAPQETGAWSLPNGDAYYEYWLRSATTTELSAEEIYELGVKELEQIHAEMRRVAHDEFGYPRDIAIYELYKRLGEKTGSTDVDDLLKINQSYLDRFEAKKDAYFNIYPTRKVILKVAYPDTTYNDPTYEDSGPYVVRLPADVMASLNRYELGPYFYHDYIPGHVASFLLLYELDLPAHTFQESVFIPAYLEGWAFYVEQLTWEMGVYADDPISNMGRLQYRALRAARLTADTGMQVKGWTLEEATAYFSAATGVPTPPSDVLRYLTTPGYGCSYYIGYLKIMELRQRAMDRLGDKFDIREFHDSILKHGQMPLAVMERVVDDWINSKLQK
jgi:uncharacterized protein (DUF885 family)